MTKKQLQKEWEKNKFEVRHQAPKIDGPYPKEIANLRQLIIFDQVILARIPNNSYDGFIMEVAHKNLMKIYEQNKKQLARYF